MRDSAQISREQKQTIPLHPGTILTSRYVVRHGRVSKGHPFMNRGRLCVLWHINGAVTVERSNSTAKRSALVLSISQH